MTDELRGDVRINAISDGRIQWPKGRRLDQTGGHAGADAGRRSHATPETWLSGRAKAGDHGRFRVRIPESKPSTITRGRGRSAGGDGFAEAVQAIMTLPLSDAEKAEGVRRLLKGPQ